MHLTKSIIYTKMYGAIYWSLNCFPNSQPSPVSIQFRARQKPNDTPSNYWPHHIFLCRYFCAVISNFHSPTPLWKKFACENDLHGQCSSKLQLLSTMMLFFSMYSSTVSTDFKVFYDLWHALNLSKALLYIFIN